MLLSVAHETQLIEGRLVGRYDRFIADVRLGDGRVVHTHCVNPGRMEGQVQLGQKVWISRAPEGRKRKLKYTWELSLDGENIVGANTNAPNRIIEALLRARKAPALTRFDRLGREVRYGEKSRADFCLYSGKEGGKNEKRHWVEVKNCHLVYPDGRGYFPDSVSDRAAHHIQVLTDQVAAGDRATVLFVVQHPEAKSIRPSDLHDPVFAAACREAKDRGVRFRAVRVVPTLEAYVVDRRIPVDLAPYSTTRHARWRTALDATSGWKRRGPVPQDTQDD
ncbi:MAG: DNA/RNA nuclease SfsA [Deltaproteobacteria bacterium]|nr:DNA/RNA nuclease SfsA [Deltaproteobacteria bacterium]